MNLLELFAPVRTFVFDVDGVLTDGTVLLAEDGQMLCAMNTRDGYAMQLAIKKGYSIWVITGSRSEGARLRLHKLGIEEVHLGIEHKKNLLLEIAAKKKIDALTILYMGDDIPDFAAMQQCGLPCCPADAAHEIKQISKYISPMNGGKGCVRDVIEKVLKLNGDWELPV